MTHVDLIEKLLRLVRSLGPNSRGYPTHSPCSIAITPPRETAQSRKYEICVVLRMGLLWESSRLGA